jgi:hypothetical protein
MTTMTPKKRKPIPRRFKRRPPISGDVAQMAHRYLAMSAYSRTEPHPSPIIQLHRWFLFRCGRGLLHLAGFDSHFFEGRASTSVERAGRRGVHGHRMCRTESGRRYRLYAPGVDPEGWYIAGRWMYENFGRPLEEQDVLSPEAANRALNALARSSGSSSRSPKKR